MSIDEVMEIAHEYREALTLFGRCLANTNLRAAIEQHVAEAVADALKQCLSDCCTQAIRERGTP